MNRTAFVPLLGALALGAAAACGLELNGVSDPAPVDAGITDAPRPIDAHHADAMIDANLPDANVPLDANLAVDANVPTDANADAPPDAPCTGVICNGACLAASTCATCNGAPLLCAPSKTCVSACGSCSDPTGGPARPIECFTCDQNRENPVGTCEPNDRTAYCLNGNYGNGHHCACANHDCPGSSQVCIPYGNERICATCGEPTAPPTDRQSCKAGGQCNATASPPHCN